MSGKTGKKFTGRKPTSVRRQSAMTDGATGREKPERIRQSGVNRNLDKAVRKGGAGGGA